MLLCFIYCCNSRACSDGSCLSPRQCLDFLLGYNLPLITIHHNAVNQHSLGTTNTDYNLHAPRQNTLIRLWSPDKLCCFYIPNDLFDCNLLFNAFLILNSMISVYMHGIISDLWITESSLVPRIRIGTGDTSDDIHWQGPVIWGVNSYLSP